MRLAHIEKDGNLIKFCNIRNHEWNLWIDNEIFIKAIILGEEEYDFNVVLNHSINDISLIIFHTINKLNIHEFNLCNGLFHHLTKPANHEYTNNNSLNVFYYKGIYYSCEEWLILPERIREIRQNKLQLI